MRPPVSRVARATGAGYSGCRNEINARSLKVPFDTPKTRFERQEHLQIAYVLTPSIITTWVAPKQATRQRDLQGIQALFRTRTGDPLLTMEVLYQLS